MSCILLAVICMQCEMGINTVTATVNLGDEMVHVHLGKCWHVNEQMKQMCYLFIFPSTISLKQIPVQVLLI